MEQIVRHRVDHRLRHLSAAGAIEDRRPDAVMHPTQRAEMPRESPRPSDAAHARAVLHSSGWIALGSALPPLRFITCPTKKPISLALAAPEARHLVGVRRQHLVDPAGERAAVAHLDQAERSATVRGSSGDRRQLGEDPLGGLRRSRVPSATSAISAARRAGSTANAPVSFEPASTSPMTQFAAVLALGARRDDRFEVVGDGRLLRQHARIVVGEAVAPVVNRCACRGQLRQRGRCASIHAGSSTSGGRSGSGK